METKMPAPLKKVRESSAEAKHLRLIPPQSKCLWFFFLDAPPSLYEMGNAISSLIAQESGGGQEEGEECVLISEETSLVLTCCWVSLKVKQNQMHHLRCIDTST